MKKVVAFALTIFWILPVSGQKRFFDPTNTQLLVWKNKKDYDDNKEGKKNQEVETVSMTKLKSVGEKCKQVFDYLDNKISKAFIVIADVYTAKEIAESIKRCYDYQSKILYWVSKKPWLAVVYYNYEAKIIKDVKSLIALTSLCVITYAQISKMSVANRRIVYAQIEQEMKRIEFKSMGLAALCQMAAYGENLRSFKVLQPYFNDKEAVERVIKAWKN